MRQDSQAAQDSMPGPAQPSRRSNSAIHRSSSACAAAIRPARRQIPSASSSTDKAERLVIAGTYAPPTTF
jgi:hypothetical protein